jgi:peptidoglycan/LPS O-acetylase OafA/YrhL
MAYGVYLWHWPVVLILAEKTDLSPAPALLVATAITLVIASLSYRLVERPSIVRFAARRMRRRPSERPGGDTASVALAGD